MSIDKFVRYLEYDRSYAADMYNTNAYWADAVAKLREYGRTTFAYHPDSHTFLCEFVEFITGNGFDIIETQRVNYYGYGPEQDIKVVVRRKGI